MKTKAAERGSWLLTGINPYCELPDKFPAMFREIFEIFRRILKFIYLFSPRFIVEPLTMFPEPCLGDAVMWYSVG